MSALPTYIGPIPPRPSTWRTVAAAVALLTASPGRGLCGAAEVGALLGLTEPGALRALCAAEAQGAVRYVAGAWEAP